MNKFPIEFYERNFKKNFINHNKEKIILYGIKYINKINIDKKNYEEILKVMHIMDMIEVSLKNTSFNTIINLFPIVKEYDGKKYESKDYFSTIDFLKNFNLTENINENLEDFYWNYYNYDIMNFSIKRLLCIDRLLKMKNKKTLMESLSDEFNLDYYKIGHNGKYIVNKRTGIIYLQKRD